ncbi:MAG: thioredoxin domain-containing protein [Candidatus Promineofilum sp.]|nr:thioredoxin domain-containing protein [Promineifilum sp.]MBP9656272.1 thioredoxin domain-containing protein [Promineifilum sp.]
MTNRLAGETSPYLRQHAENPVDWYPWGEEALQRARDEDKPILLSIGYAACHWCHVMAHESFEDPATAEIMNRYYVNIKVDREERPDLDSIYMSAVQAMTGQGGWPMTVIATPDGRPFFGGTYYPPVPRHGMPAFKQVLLAVADAWSKRREEIERSAGEIAVHLQEISSAEAFGGGGVLNADLIDRALDGLLHTFDAKLGGFGQAPKFPPSMTLEFLLRVHAQRGDAMALRMVEYTLTMMARGGLYDQIGGGFARYSTDDRWLVPHFEKMLYDNALLARVYLHAWQVTGKPLYRRIVEETLDFVVREMRHESGGFYSSYDADSEGEEGKFYVWSAAEIRAALGPDADLFMVAYDVSDRGNWEGRNILNRPRDPAEVAALYELDEAELERRLAANRQTLYAVRASRIWPGLDDKVLTAWNGLMLAAFAEAGRALNRPDYTEIATRNAEFLWANLRQDDGRLLRSWKAGAGARYNGYLEDYAFLAGGLLALYRTTFEPRWFVWARELADRMMIHFSDGAGGGFYDTSDDHETLLHRPKDLQDNATPSGNSMAAQVLLLMGLYTGEGGYWDTAEAMVAALSDPMARYPGAFSQWLAAATLILGQPQEVAIAGNPGAADTQALLDVVNGRYRPDLVVAVGDDAAAGIIPLLADRPRIDGRATAYVCRRFVCRLPVNEPGALAEQLDGAAAG